MGHVDEDVPGAIFAVNTKTDELFKLPLIGWPEDKLFFPHGIALARENEFFVVNHGLHRGGDDTVEVFTVVSDEETGLLSLEHRFSITEDLSNLQNSWHGEMAINDVASLVPGEIYVTQWKYPELRFKEISTLNRIVDEIAMLFFKWTTVFRCTWDPEEGRQADARCEPAQATNHRVNFAMANGITADVERQTLYVADMTGHNKERISAFKRMADGRLEFLGHIETEGGPDNIQYDPKTDRIYAGTIPTLSDILQLKHNMSFPVHGLVEAITPIQEHGQSLQKATAVLAVDGSELCHTSAGFLQNDHVYVGSPFFTGLLKCPMPGS